MVIVEPGLAFTLKLPSMSVTVATFEPLTLIVAPRIGSPFESFTLPRIWDCAKPATELKLSKKRASPFFSIILILCISGSFKLIKLLG